MTDQQQPLGPEDDPYLAYLIWREERDAAAAPPDHEEPTLTVPAPRSWLRHLAVWRRPDSDGPER
ncbi:hypothetical protein [Agromyces sp. NPDC049794]|uniref:hypothetical protein n=1 Tax=unclassified Agromyces TaxID=2639701 RepID=UPI0033E98B26